jgi:alkylation response protein AidB-like acyl-CoA dehydrogenase
VELEFTSDQEELRDSVRSVLSRECPIGVVREVVEKGVDTGALWEHMTQLYWPALTVPEAYGGMGLGMVELAVLTEELGRAVAPGPLFATVAMFVPAIREGGTDEQQRRFLTPVAEGTLSGTLAVAEASGSWEPDDIGAEARRDGDGWALSGTKHFVMEGDRVAEVVVAARAGDGLGLFVVPGAEVAATAIRTLDGTRHLASIVLDGVRVPADRALGEPGTAEPGLRRALEEATAAASLELVGTCSAIFEIALDYAKVREQFGVKIGSFQAMKHKFADMYVALEAARATSYFAAVAIAEDDERRSLAASMAKALAGDAERRIAQEGIQSLGGIGYTWEHDMHLYVKRAMASAALLGTAEHHRERVAAGLGVTA